MPGPIATRRSPFKANHVGYATIAIGAEAANAITATVQLQDERRRDLATRGRVRAWLSSDANGDVLLPAHLMPAGGYAIGTDGTLFKGRTFANCVLTKSTLIKDVTTAEQFSTSTTSLYRVLGAQYSKTAAVDLTFTAAHVITASKFGAILVQINAAGTISTKVVASPQAYDTAALALAALPSPDAGNIALGYIQIANNTGDWTANTDDLTNGSDVTTAAFVDASEVGDFPNVFDLMSEADGDIDLVFTETGVRNPFYLNLEVAGGDKVTSGVIQFA